MGQKPTIDQIFGADSVQAILGGLNDLALRSKSNAEWAENTRGTILQKSPLSLSVAFRQIREGAALSMADCMKMEFRILNRMLDAGDFLEGIRAAIIDKDGAPNWQPNTLDDVAPKRVDAHFAPLDNGELQL